MLRYFRNVFRDEGGAVSVDWVVLSAGAVVLALGAATLILGGTKDSTNTLATTISDRPVGN